MKKTIRIIRNGGVKVLFLVIFLLVQAIPAIAPSAVSGLSAEQKKLMQSGVRYFNVENDNLNICGSGPAAASGLAAGSKIYMIGDSISVQSKTELEANYTGAGFTDTINALSGRAISVNTNSGTETGILAAQNDASIISDADAVVVALGTNSGTEDLNIQIPALVQAIRSAPGKSNIPIYWVNLFYTADGGPSARNAVITAYAPPEKSNYTIINALSANIALDTDGIHPTTEGRTKFAQTVIGALTASAAPAANGPAGTADTPEDGVPAHILTYPNITDETAAAKAIDDYIRSKAPTSPFVGLGKYFISGAKKSNVNPFLAVGHLQQENGFATGSSGWHTLSPPTYNAFGATSSAPPFAVYHGKTHDYNVLIWPSWEGSLDSSIANSREDWFASIRRKYLNPGSTYESHDFQTYISHYAPGSDGNNEGGYIDTLYSVIDSITQSLGISGGGAGSVSNPACPGSNLSPGVNGWDLPGDSGGHPMIYYSQLREESASNPHDPAVTSFWGNSPYGPGPIAVCGCGPTSFAMIVATLKNDPSITPDKVAAWAHDNGFQETATVGACGGSAWWWTGNPAKTAEKWGVKSHQISITDAPGLLKEGKLIITSVGAGSALLSDGGIGHLLVMRAVTDDGKFLFADPSDSISKRNNGGDSGNVNIFKPLGSSHTPLDAATVSSGLKGLFVVEPI